MEQWITVVLGRVVGDEIQADEPSSLNKRPVIDGKAKWGLGFFGEHKVTVVGYVVQDSRGTRPYRFPGLINIRPDCTFEVCLMSDRWTKRTNY